MAEMGNRKLGSSHLLNTEACMKHLRYFYLQVRIFSIHFFLRRDKNFMHFPGKNKQKPFFCSFQNDMDNNGRVPSHDSHRGLCLFVLPVHAPFRPVHLSLL